MPTTLSRINIAMEPELYKTVERLAREQDVPLAAAARNLLVEALELLEDRALAAWAGERERTFRRGGALTHEAAWGRSAARKASRRRARR